MQKRSFWNGYLRAYDTLNLMPQYRAYQDDLAARVGARPGLRVLDAGSGTGNLSIIINGLGAQVTSLDLYRAAQDIHRQKQPDAHLVTASLEEPLSFSDSEFDVVVCASVLFALSDEGVRSALAEFRRILIPGGRLLVTASRKTLSVAGMLCGYFKSRWGKLGLIGFAEELRSTIPGIARLLYHTYRIRGLNRQQGYRRFERDELVSVVCRAGFVETTTTDVFQGSFHLVQGRRPRAG